MFPAIDEKKKAETNKARTGRARFRRSQMTTEQREEERRKNIDKRARTRALQKAQDKEEKCNKTQSS